MRQTLSFNNFSVDKYLFQKKKERININKIDIKKIVLSNKVSYGKQGAYKYYVGYLYGDSTNKFIY